MKTLKLLSLLVFSLFFLSTVSAVAVYGDWQDSSQSITITNGDSINFNAEAFSVNSNVILNIKMYDSQSVLVYTFEENRQINKGILFSEQYTITPSIYLSQGDYEIKIIASDSEGSRTKTLSLDVNPLIIPDTTAPVITLVGANPITLTIGTAYTEYGATALDAVDGDITGNIVRVNPVNVFVAGTYIVTYNVQDNSGNSAVEVTRTVNVVANPVDTTAPVITLVGANPLTLTVGTAYTEYGATALDDVDGDLTANIIITGIVDVNTIGTYTITYNVQDSSGNFAIQVIRTVNIIASTGDTTAPVITIITPENNEEYDDSDLTFEIQVNEIAEVEFSIDGGNRVAMNYEGIANGILTFTYDVELEDGDYTITFYTRDTSGNTASRTIDFSVETNAQNNNNNNHIRILGQEENTETETQIIYLDEEETTLNLENLNWFQRFIAWLKDLFGFN